MLVTRGLALSRAALKNIPKIVRNEQSAQLQQIRGMSGAWRYRTGAAPHSRAVRWCTQAVGGFAWWWILWHLWWEFDHIIGDYPYIDPSTWTDEELGIPPDDE